jgi:folylpolyglutamate synthase
MLTNARRRHVDQDAIDKLNSLQSNFAAIEASRASGGRMVQFAKHDTIEYLGRIGYTVSVFFQHLRLYLTLVYQVEDLNRLNVIHVTGTKGKGSTCAFVDSLLRSIVPNRKVGKLSNKHLMPVLLNFS